MGIMLLFCLREGRPGALVLRGGLLVNKRFAELVRA